MPGLSGKVACNPSASALVSRNAQTALPSASTAADPTASNANPLTEIFSHHGGGNRFNLLADRAYRNGEFLCSDPGDWLSSAPER